MAPAQPPLFAVTGAADAVAPAQLLLLPLLPLPLLLSLILVLH